MKESKQVMLHYECASSKLNLNTSKLEGLKVADSVALVSLDLNPSKHIQT